MSAPDSFDDAPECSTPGVGRSSTAPDSADPERESGVFDAPFEEGVDSEGFTERQRDFYQGLRTKIRDWLERRGKGFKYADMLLVAPDLFHVLCRLVADKRIPALQKGKLAGAIAYFISPIGLIPEAFTGPIGYIDDVALAAYVLSGMLNSDHAHIVREHWAGDDDVLKVVQGILDVAERALGGGIWQRVKDMKFPQKKD